MDLVRSWVWYKIVVSDMLIYSLNLDYEPCISFWMDFIFMHVIEEFFPLPRSYEHSAEEMLGSVFIMCLSLLWQTGIKTTWGRKHLLRANGLRVQPMKVQKPRWQGPEAYGYSASAVRKQREESSAQLAFSLLIYPMGQCHAQSGGEFLPQFAQSRNSLTDVPSTWCPRWFWTLSSWQLVLAITLVTRRTG